MSYSEQDKLLRILAGMDPDRPVRIKVAFNWTELYFRLGLITQSGLVYIVLRAQALDYLERLKNHDVSIISKIWTEKSKNLDLSYPSVSTHEFLKSVVETYTYQFPPSDFSGIEVFEISHLPQLNQQGREIKSLLSFPIAIRPVIPDSID